MALGFSMDLHTVIKAGMQGMGLAAATIAGTWGLGMLLGKWLGIERGTANLVCAGTAICGGSAIAAVGSVTEAGEAEMSVALGTVFVLNAVALFVFPTFGHWMGLTQVQFGTWAGIAIHDISSVVGASAHYGAEALQVATAVKLSRALWIIPVSLIAAFLHRRSQAIATGAPVRISIPWFIGLFLLASLVRTMMPGIASFTPDVTFIAAKGLTLTLFLIGAGMARENLRAVGVRPFVLGGALWIAISAASLFAVLQF